MKQFCTFHVSFTLATAGLVICRVLVVQGESKATAYEGSYNCQEDNTLLSVPIRSWEDPAYYCLDHSQINEQVALTSDRVTFNSVLLSSLCSKQETLGVCNVTYTYCL